NPKRGSRRNKKSDPEEKESCLELAFQVKGNTTSDRCGKLRPSSPMNPLHVSVIIKEPTSTMGVIPATSSPQLRKPSVGNGRMFDVLIGHRSNSSLFKGGYDVDSAQNWIREVEKIFCTMECIEA
ncbi:hypothetical protein CR513_30173, partial [Mucuna pruriens]